MKYKLIIDQEAEEEIIAIVHSPSSLTQKIEDLVCGYTGYNEIIGYSENGMRKLTFGEVECITVVERRVIAIDCKGDEYRLRDRLRELEDILPSYFIRINKSTLANEHRIESFEAVFNGGIDAVFKCGYREYVSRRCFAEIKRRYEGK